MDFAAGDIQSQSELLPFSSNACTTQTPPAVTPRQPDHQELLADNFSILPTPVTGMRSTLRNRIAENISQKNRTTLVPPVPTDMPRKQLRLRKNRERPYQEKKRLRKKKKLPKDDVINCVVANVIPPSEPDILACRPLILRPCVCPLCLKRFERYGLIEHL